MTRLVTTGRKQPTSRAARRHLKTFPHIPWFQGRARLNPAHARALRAARPNRALLCNYGLLKYPPADATLGPCRETGSGGALNWTGCRDNADPKARISSRDARPLLEIPLVTLFMQISGISERCSGACPASFFSSRAVIKEGLEPRCQTYQQLLPPKTHRHPPPRPRHPPSLTPKSLPYPPLAVLVTWL